MAIRRKCEGCGAQFEAPTVRRRFCSDQCRARTTAAKRRGAVQQAARVVRLPGASGAMGKIEQATVDQLGDQADSVVGVRARAIAKQLDEGVPAASWTSMDRQLGVLLAEAERVASVKLDEDVEDDPIALLQQRARERAARVG